MVHPHRVYQVTTTASVDELAAIVTEHTWTLCTAFELDGYLFLNDSFSADGAQEYAVVKDGRQVESLTFGWCTRDRAAELIRAVLGGQHVGMRFVSPRLNHGPVCHLCR